jgi:HEAT repeat protein
MRFLYSRKPIHRQAVLAAAALATGAIAVLPGCGITSEQRSQMAESNSVLAPFMRTMSPREAAEWAADPYDADKRARGTTMLANAAYGGADAYLELYRKYTTDESEAVRAAAARGLAMHGSPSDVPLVLPLLKDPEKSVRLDAAKALQRLHNPVAIPALIDEMDPKKETEPDVRAAVASAMGQYADAKVMDVLIAALADDNYLVSFNAYQSLRTLTGNDDLPDERRPWVQWAAGHKEPFAKQRPYYYPVFYRDKEWTDYLPIVGGPVPNEQKSQPVGMPTVAGASGGAETPGGGTGR